MEAIILAGGFGTRLQSAVNDVPKPMAPINGQPFLTYLLKYLLKYDIRSVLLSTGYKHEVIEDYYGSCFQGVMRLEYSVEKEPLGTGGAIAQSMRYTTEEDIIVINGDTFFNVDLKEMMLFHRTQAGEMTMALKPMSDFERYGKVDHVNNRVVKFQEKQYTSFGDINGGVYILNRSIFNGCNLEKTFSFETDFLQKHLQRIQVNSYIADEYFIDIGIPEDYYKAQSELIKFE
ncbi:nucleotidyltransferase family protein [Paenibacillus guangzhouensis]|uniref:nucleotidyltransferase family protein n=1 Tax=Paenibacillus guangzhouensis TaxID=1473112 RepID=UPI0012677DCB|nr:nucleotidyltransferase family protein [Paenibacillus guangzhouensis]